MEDVKGELRSHENDRLDRMNELGIVARLGSIGE
jgi:hypothetical protein